MGWVEVRFQTLQDLLHNATAAAHARSNAAITASISACPISSPGFTWQHAAVESGEHGPHAVVEQQLRHQHTAHFVGELDSDDQAGLPDLDDPVGVFLLQPGERFGPLLDRQIRAWPARSGRVRSRRPGTPVLHLRRSHMRPAVALDPGAGLVRWSKVAAIG